ncbi:MAG TPA: 4Fe-4S ferredoxin [Bacteroidetes bacterium]|nr:4Fe-4S ferredoxin [Bacteroidota bacterium]HEX04241.1 4Fe-4S ferredoxin [Bacteroidota bacterium]
MALRTIVQIDEDLCDGCGDCIPNCVEGALKIINGKAKLVSDVYCDGFGACLGHCPQDAIKMIEREAEEFDEQAVEEYLGSKPSALVDQNTDPVTSVPPRMSKPAPMCPGSMARSIAPPVERNDALATGSNPGEPTLPSHLQSWPVQLHLLNPGAPFLAGSDLLLCADCVPFAYPNFHRDFLKEHTVAVGCPKLDDTSPYVGKLTEMLQRGLRSLTVLHMEVPCCGGIVQMAGQALNNAAVDIPVRVVRIGVRGEILTDETVGNAA